MITSKKCLSFTNLRKVLSKCFNAIKDYRQINKVKHSIHDVLMSGFACMYFQDPSLLQFLDSTHKCNSPTITKVELAVTV
jgi:hypothetical protein